MLKNVFLRGKIEPMGRFYGGTGLQLAALITVGICFLSGVTKGDYGKIELVQFLGGMGLFLMGSILKGRT